MATVTTMKIRLPYLIRIKDRSGVLRWYARRFRRYVRVHGEPGTEAFLQSYREAVEALSGRRPPKASSVLEIAPTGSLAWLGEQYFASAEFRALDPQSQRSRRNILRTVFRLEYQYGDGSREPLGHAPAKSIGTKAIRFIRDRSLKEVMPHSTVGTQPQHNARPLAHGRGAANNRRKYLSSMFGWAVEAGLLPSNPTRDVRKVKYATEGFRMWTVEEVAQFEAYHPIGSKAHLALALFLFTGARRGDVVRFGPQHVKNGWLRFVPAKTSYRRKEAIEIPVLPELAAIIAASPCGHLAFLTTEYGKPFSAAGFGGWFRKRCDEAGLLQCAAHGLRKAGATIAAEHGATTAQLNAIFGWSTMQQAEVYIRRANRKRLAGDAMPLLGRKG